MQQQKSFEREEEKGILYLVPTPIGNLEDISFRSLRILKEVNVIAAEDTRNTKRLCNYFEIDTPLVSYHEHNKKISGPKLIEQLKEGTKIALVSDAGLPTISDPGYELVCLAIEEGLTVVPLPGANAALTALIASGIQTQPFFFYGFLQRGKKDKRKELEQLARQTSTLIFYEAPHRLRETLLVMAETLGEERKITLSRELTKKFEEFIRGTIKEAVVWVESNEVRGEFCLIVEGGSGELVEDQNSWWQELSINQHVEHYIHTNNMTSKAAIKQTAKDRDMNKRDVYQAFHIE
ncbi:16S rRNA (cytidine(1402)-2'-O)-methyltransferase [Mesobacillus maritimus]|uniref:16S rRNA (cytidine(1402)-2'-O)-methyltransferase n=1 Tax=Mesobacillus maritimus TaxID=1643336 RepID=UPI0020422085|nr:16S rRNA (cytidine(1402)-2'-O)-methyltransferase [Mesobacillus maritimus]MCM3588583.1 16S rRNA (cytidine(1402)-2'-O)-methyltransferase [Mesobacillus maritimus]